MKRLCKALLGSLLAGALVLLGGLFAGALLLVGSLVATVILPSSAYGGDLEPLVFKANDTEATNGTPGVFPTADQVKNLVDGAVATPISWQGTWSAETDYSSGQGVIYEGSSYAAIGDPTTGDIPGVDADWQLIASKGDTGATGEAGASAYVYIAWASASDGTGFTTTFDANLDYIAVLSTDTAIPSPAAGDFTGLWKNYKGATGEQGLTGNDGLQTVSTIATAGTAQTISWTDYDTYVVNLSAASCELTLAEGTNVAAGQERTICVIAVQDGTGGRDVTWAGATLDRTPRLNAAANAKTVLYLTTRDQGTTAEVIAPTVHYAQITIVDPEAVQAITDAVSILAVEATWAPSGIRILDCRLKTSASSTYAINLEEWTSPTDGSPSTIEAVATSSSTEAEGDGTLSDADVAAGSIVRVDLPTTAEAEITVGFTYLIK
jgi:hypothetical protein